MAAGSRLGSSSSAWFALCLLVGASFLVEPTEAFAVTEEDLACTGEDPLLLREWSYSEPRSSVRWQLPVSSTSSTLTEAFLRVSFAQAYADQDWEAQVVIDFVNPLPYAIPFGFQHIALEWTDALGRQISALDWSAVCTSPGPAIYPGQELRFSLPLPGTAGLNRLEMPRLRLWGSRN